MNEMRPTPPSSLLLAAGIALAIGWMTTWAFYRNVPPINLVASVFLFVLAIACVVLGRIVRKRIADGEIGHDRSQLSPVTAAQWMLFGQSVAWIGAVLSGAYAGISIHVLLNAGELQAAANDVPGALAGVVGGAAAAIAGSWLERGCQAPPADSLNAAMSTE